jgi:hypothetical protein
MRNEFNFYWENPDRIRCCEFFNNVVEQDSSTHQITRPAHARIQEVFQRSPGAARHRIHASGRIRGSST